RSDVRVLLLGTLELLLQGHQGVQPLLKTFTMAVGLGLRHLCLLHSERFSLLVRPLVCHLQRLVEVLSLALLVPVGTDNCLAAIVGIEGPMVNHPLEAIFLYLGSLPV